MSIEALAGDCVNSKARDGSIALCVASCELRRIRVARSFWSRLVGLLNRSGLDADEGLLLDPGGSIHTLWMRFAIDVVFLDQDLAIVRIAENVKPWRMVRAPRRTRFVLELAAGVSSRVGFQCGVVLRPCRQLGTDAAAY